MALRNVAGPNKHAVLIRTVVAALLDTVASGYELVFVDDEDGDRIQGEYKQRLAELGLAPDLSSKWPDAILVHVARRLVWFVDAVTNDGEIDDPRADALVRWAESRRYGVGGLTTAYETWRRAATRQGPNRNLAIGSTLWIGEDGGKLFEVQPLIPDQV